MGHQHAWESSLMHRNPTKKKILSTGSSRSISLVLCPMSVLPRTCQHSTAEPILRLVLFVFICSTCNSPLWLLIKTEQRWPVIFLKKMLFFRFKWWPLFPFPIARRHLCDGDRCEQNQTFSVSVHAACGTTPCLLQPCSKWIWLYESPM